MEIESEPHNYKDEDPNGTSLGSIHQFRGTEEEEAFENEQRLELVRSVTSGNSKDILERLETLSREMSRRTARDNEIKIDPNDFDLNRILLSFIQIASSQGIKLRKSGVSFQDLSVYGVDQSFSIAPTTYDLMKGPVGAIQNVIKKRRIPDRAILKNINGYAKSGEMVLVLGRPGAGCSTLLKSIGGTDLDLYTGMDGDIRYDGISQKEMLKKFKNDLVYVPELDVHFPHLTVEQTLRFAIACKTPKLRVNDVSRERFIDSLKEILATVFGLRHTYHTKVGNDFVRGISGGERKRVSIAEALSCRGSIYCWDNATRGLDASTALEYTRAIRTSTNLLKNTAFVAIYQASENIYEAFDKVTVLYEGRQVYFGPVLEAKQYFEEMGYQCPPRQATAEFLTAITDPIGRFPKPGFEDKVPTTAEDFERYWLNSKQYNIVQEEIKAYNDSINGDETREVYYKSLLQEKMNYSRTNSKFTINYLQQLKLCTIRGFQGIWGDKAYSLTTIGAALSQGLIAGSLYYNTPDSVSGAFSRGGVIFFSALYVSLMGLAQVSASFNSRPILMKHKNYSMYHPSADALAGAITSAPVNLISTFLFVLVIYFLSNLKREAGKFFVCVLFVFLLAMTMSGLFEAVASLNKTISSANAIAGVFVLASLVYSSYMIQRPSMHPWFKWISYIDPILYAFEAIIATEFHGRKMECDGTYWTPSGPGYQGVDPANQVCAFKGSVPGQSWVSGDEYLDIAFTYKFTHVWRNFGILLGFFIFFTGIKALGVEFVRPISGGGDRLLFLRGRVPDSVILPEEKVNHQDLDIECRSEPSSNTLENPNRTKTEDKLKIFENIKSKDVFIWKNVNYVVKYEGKDRTLLDNISGYCIPGSLTALMGESGAGKTTLLNTLAQRIDVGVVTGDMLVNGKKLDLSFLRRTGYVQQQDIHAEELTVRESLRFSARLRRTNDISDEDKLDYVEKIIKALDMELYSDALVGRTGDGLNVEQKKKLSIAVELVAKPSLLLFLDEPTSGLDSQSAWAVVKLLRELSNAGQSILCTIHQPSATLFEEFDRLLLLKKGGQTVYFGDIGEHSNAIVSYFERNGARKCDDYENPAEYILEAIGAGATATIEQDWYQTWFNSPERIESDKECDRLINELSIKREETYNEKELKQLQSTYAVPYWYQFRYVVSRNASALWRTPEYIAGKIFLMTISGLFIGFTFFGLKHTLTGMQNGMFAAFLAVVVSAPVINQIQAQAIKGRDLFEGREKLSNTYHWSLMIIAQCINELPYLIFGATLMFVSLYFPTQADSSPPHSGMFYLTQGILLQGFAVTFGLLILYIAPNLESAAVLFSFFYTFVVAFSGVVQPTNLMPGFWTFMNKVSPYTYFIQNLVSSFLHSREVKCNDIELAYFNPPSGQTCELYASKYVKARGGYISNPQATQKCGYCSYSVADEYLSIIGAKWSYRWRNIGFFFVYIIFNLSLVLALYWTIRFRKGSIFSVFKRNK